MMNKLLQLGESGGENEETIFLTLQFGIIYIIYIIYIIKLFSRKRAKK